MPQLNNDGVAGYSANGWLAPITVFVALSVYADMRSPANPPPLQPAGERRSKRTDTIVYSGADLQGCN
jgi:hypothetical protein